MQLRVAYETISLPFEELSADLGCFDLVLCSNVIDQCFAPRDLVRVLQKSTAPGGVLTMTCTYQWNDKYIGNASEPINDIQELFDSEWVVLGETNIPFHVRVCERYWKTFLSHAVTFARR